mmetsp:Transcript_34773/g.88066  ORF Transcript_34773/g.88066 Transcript_34773/m.88066 type:complete len:263 (+) Transcript_34773:189-977(+)
MTWRLRGPRYPRRVRRAAVVAAVAIVTRLRARLSWRRGPSGPRRACWPTRWAWSTSGARSARRRATCSGATPRCRRWPCPTGGLCRSAARRASSSPTTSSRRSGGSTAWTPRCTRTPAGCSRSAATSTSRRARCATCRTPRPSAWRPGRWRASRSPSLTGTSYEQHSDTAVTLHADASARASRALLLGLGRLEWGGTRTSQRRVAKSRSSCVVPTGTCISCQFSGLIRATAASLDCRDRPAAAGSTARCLEGWRHRRGGGWV